jgi:hypothetical protein
MSIVTVTHMDASKKGTKRVYFDGKDNWQDAYYLGRNCPLPAIGARIDAQVSSKDFNDDGRQTWFLNDWKPVEAAKASSAPKAKDAPGGWDIPTGDLSRFVSNIVGSAIAAGLIKEPGEIALWCSSAYRSAQGLRSGKVLDFDDGVPDLSGEADPSESHGVDEDDDIPF